MPLRRLTAGLTTLLAVSACATQPDQAAAPPANPDLGIAHPYDLYAHCGIRYAVFGGQTWKVEHPVIDPPGEPLARGSIDSVPGTMRLAAEDRLQFTVDGSSRVLPGEVLTFRPTTETPPLCQ